MLSAPHIELPPTVTSTLTEVNILSNYDHCVDNTLYRPCMLVGSTFGPAILQRSCQIPKMRLTIHSGIYTPNALDNHVKGIQVHGVSRDYTSYNSCNDLAYHVSVYGWIGIEFSVF